MAITVIHPGEHLAEKLKALNISAAELARQLKVPTNRITQIVNGTRAITGDTALRLAHFFGTSAEIWLNLQSRYDLWLAQKKAGKWIKALRIASHPELDERLLGKSQNSNVDLRTFINTISALAWSSHPDGSIDFVNQRWTEYTGLSPEESYGLGWKAAIHSDDLPASAAKWEARPDVT